MECLVCDFSLERVAAYKRLRGGVLVIDKVPRAPSGKVLRRLLVDHVVGPDGDGGSAPPLSS